MGRKITEKTIKWIVKSALKNGYFQISLIVIITLLFFGIKIFINEYGSIWPYEIKIYSYNSIRQK